MKYMEYALDQSSLQSLELNVKVLVIRPNKQSHVTV